MRNIVNILIAFSFMAISLYATPKKEIYKCLYSNKDYGKGTFVLTLKNDGTLSASNVDFPLIEWYLSDNGIVYIQPGSYVDGSLGIDNGSIYHFNENNREKIGSCKNSTLKTQNHVNNNEPDTSQSSIMDKATEYKKSISDYFSSTFGNNNDNNIYYIMNTNPKFSKKHQKLSMYECQRLSTKTVDKLQLIKLRREDMYSSSLRIYKEFLITTNKEFCMDRIVPGEQ